VFDESESKRLPIFDRGEDRTIGIGKSPLLVELQANGGAAGDGVRIGRPEVCPVMGRHAAMPCVSLPWY